MALARALVNEPAVLLLDEPLGALDLKLRKQMQHELKAMQQRLGISFIYVTHDQEEAMTMADRIGVMHDGQLLQIGAPEEIYEQPADRFVADFIGETNFLEGRLEETKGERGSVRTRKGGLVLQGMLPAERIATGADVTLTIRPEKLTPARGARAESQRRCRSRRGNDALAGDGNSDELYRHGYALRGGIGGRRALDGAAAEFRPPLRYDYAVGEAVQLRLGRCQRPRAAR